MYKPTFIQMVIGGILAFLCLVSCSQNKKTPQNDQNKINVHTDTFVQPHGDSLISKKQNFPPQWEMTPRNVCTIAKHFLDTLIASDPESSPITYHLVKGPQGFILDNQTGIIDFTPKSAGVFSIEIEASDTANFSTKMNYELTVRAAKHKIDKPKPTAILNVPSMVSPGEMFIIDASHSVKNKDLLKNFKFRFDVDGNGTWDIPAEGAFGSSPITTIVFKTEGTNTVSVQVKGPDNQIAQASGTIIVRAKPVPKPIPQIIEAPPGPQTPPVAKAKDSIKVLPPLVVNANGPYQEHSNKPLELSGTIKNPDARIVKYAWDFFGKGTFDWSSATSGITEHTYTKPGTYKAVFKVTTIDAKQWFDTAVITIINAPPKAHAGKNVLSKKGKTVKLNGVGEDSDGRIALYEWDFSGDGKYEWSSPKTGSVEHDFNEYSTVILRVTDDAGASACDTLSVVICPSGMESVKDGSYCIDTYEWPNVAGKDPDRDMTFFDAQKKCADNGKHLCTAQEWETACQGNHKQKYPTSNSPAIQTCNVLGNHYFPNKVAPSGSFSDCKSPVGAFDMNGNVAEWTQSGSADSAFVYGGSWHHDVEFTTCSSKLLLVKSKSYFYVGFRCCK